MDRIEYSTLRRAWTDLTDQEFLSEPTPSTWNVRRVDDCRTPTPFRCQPSPDGPAPPQSLQNALHIVGMIEAFSATSGAADGRRIGESGGPVTRPGSGRARQRRAGRRRPGSPSSGQHRDGVGVGHVVRDALHVGEVGTRQHEHGDVVVRRTRFRELPSRSLPSSASVLARMTAGKKVRRHAG